MLSTSNYVVSVAIDSLKKICSSDHSPEALVKSMRGRLMLTWLELDLLHPAIVTTAHNARCVQFRPK
jgi:hypothetical protein